MAKTGKGLSVSKRTIYATEANSVVNLAARTATMDAGYPAGRVERLVSPEVRYVFPDLLILGRQLLA